MTQLIYNTLSGQKEPFQPLTPGKVGIYVCGPTVYDMSHIGHARVYVAFDAVVRFLRRRFAVTYVRNLTDVDDKIIKRARDLGQQAIQVSERFIREFHTDMDALGIARPDVEPKVTEHMHEIVSMITVLVRKEHAYALKGKDRKGGDVYYAVESFKNYGRLGRRELDDMEAGARVEIDERKRNPMDFALWKGMAADDTVAQWESPWGGGRPGWHIECSAMSSRYLGDTFDIHGGGKDLIFPHHENEVAQSEAANGRPFARVWMHNGFVNVDDEKMSKSLGNFFTVRDVLQKFDPQTLRYYLLTTHYRSPINFSDASLADAEARVRYLYETLARLEAKVGAQDGPAGGPWRGGVLGAGSPNGAPNALVARFEEAMEDDFNTAKAIGDLSDAFRLINDILDHPGDADQDLRTLRALHHGLRDVGSVLGLFVEPPSAVLTRMASRKRSQSTVDGTRVDGLIGERNAARQAKDFARADAIRKELSDMGVTIKDTAQGTTWELV